MRYALVTGGSRGIGRAICIKLAQMGYHLLINYASNDSEAEATLRMVRQMGQDGELMKFDVSDRKTVTATLEAWMETHPLDISLNGFYNITQPLLQPMLVHKYGRIISLASVSGMKGLPGQTNYSAAKGGIIAATKALAQEVARKNVTVNAIAPGFIKTDMVEGLDEAALKKTIPANRFGTPEEVAELAGFLASPAAAYITGNVIAIDGGLYT